MISKFKKLDLIEYVFFDGRNRGIKLHKNMKAAFTKLLKASQKNEGKVHKKMNEASQKNEHSNTDTIIDNNVNSPVFEKTEQLVFSNVQISAWQRPENLPEQLFKALQDFAIQRQGRAKKERMTERAWGIILKQAQNALSQYSETKIIEHIESGMVGNWKSPFWKGWEETMTKEQTPEQSQPLPDIEAENKYQKTIAWILKRFEYLQDSKVRQINREEWLDLFTPSGQSFKQFANYFTHEQKFAIFEQVLTKLATDNYTKKSTLYSHLLKALKDEKAVKVKQRS